MTTLEGHHFDGCSPLAVPARMEFEQLQARLMAGTVTESCPLDRLKVSARVGKSERFIALPGGTIVITDKMIETAATTDEVMAILAREIAHSIRNGREACAP